MFGEAFQQPWRLGRFKTRDQAVGAGIQGKAYGCFDLGVGFPGSEDDLADPSPEGTMRVDGHVVKAPGRKVFQGLHGLRGSGGTVPYCFQ
jgi:hypothetical protein